MPTPKGTEGAERGAPVAVPVATTVPLIRRRVEVPFGLISRAAQA